MLRNSLFRIPFVWEMMGLQTGCIDSHKKRAFLQGRGRLMYAKIDHVN
jgi:hypothetical protein